MMRSRWLFLLWFCLLAQLGCGAGVSADVRQLALPTRDLVYDRHTGKIYASIPANPGAGGNSVMEIDPATGTFGTPVFVGSEPGKLALSDDGQYLYVWDDVVLPVDFVVVENTLGKFGARVEEFNQVPRRVQTLVGKGVEGD